MDACAKAIGQGADIVTSLDAARRAIEGAGFVIDYVEARHGDTLGPLDDKGRAKGRLLAAARLGRTLLIDNVPVAQA